MSSVTIREAAPADIDGLTGLLEYLFSIEKDFPSNHDKQRRALVQLLQSTTAIVLVAEVRGQVVGMVTGQLVISTAEGGWSLLVEDLVVSRLHQGKGIGSLLLNEVSDWARARGARRMQLLADRTNSAALQFYRRHGWQQTMMVCLRRNRK